jgi:hypothetical protein
MNTNSNLYIILGSIQVLISLAAMPTGVLFIIDPSGRSLGMSPELLEGSVFNNFLIPGIFLLAVNGIGNLISAIISFLRMRIAGGLGLALGIFLTLWMVVQMISITEFNYLQPLYLLIGIIETIIGVIIIRRKKFIDL